MVFPKCVTEAAVAADDRYPEDKDAAVSLMLTRLKRRKDYEAEILPLLEVAACKRIVDLARTSFNRSTDPKSSAPSPKLRTSNKTTVYDESPSIRRITHNLLHLRIAGRMLGSILGSELAGLAEHHRQIATANYRWSELFERLRPLVSEEKRVEQCVTPQKLKKLLAQIDSELQPVEASQATGDKKKTTQGV